MPLVLVYIWTCSSCAGSKQPFVTSVRCFHLTAGEISVLSITDTARSQLITFSFTLFHSNNLPMRISTAARGEGSSRLTTNTPEPRRGLKAGHGAKGRGQISCGTRAKIIRNR